MTGYRSEYAQWQDELNADPKPRRRFNWWPLIAIAGFIALALLGVK